MGCLCNVFTASDRPASARSFAHRFLAPADFSPVGFPVSTGFFFSFFFFSPTLTRNSEIAVPHALPAAVRAGPKKEAPPLPAVCNALPMKTRMRNSCTKKTPDCASGSPVPDATLTPIAAIVTLPHAIAVSTMFPGLQCGFSSPAPTSAKKRSIGPPLKGTAQNGRAKSSSTSHTVFCPSISSICSFGVLEKNVAVIASSSLFIMLNSSQNHARCWYGKITKPYRFNRCRTSGCKRASIISPSSGSSSDT
mmetsp:Transcript_306/g.1150  ORF Transcript_306/g.1150 Transcript_306/m.1150 type:complete len:250 (+) Transcript_306:2233-2982(+)